MAQGQDAQHGELLNLSATATYDNGQTVNVNDLANWSSSDLTLAEPDEDGQIQIPYYENGGNVSITASLGSQSGSETIPASARSSIGLRAIFSMRA